MPFKSLQQDINLPRDLTTWQWLFEHPTYSPLFRYPESRLGGYTNAATKESLNWRQVKDCATHLSTVLVRRYGLETGDTVALFSQNTIWYPVAMHATLRVGGKISGASPAYNVEEMTYALQKADAKFLMTHANSMEVATAAAKAAGIPKERLFLLEGKLQGFKTIKELIEEGKKESDQVPYFTIPRGKTNFDICGFLSFSSGTTGLPKAVMIAHQNVIAQCLQVQQVTPNDLTRVLAVLPSFHITGLVHALHLPVLINAEVIMQPSFTMKSMLDTVVEYKLRELLLVPPILIRMVRDPIVDQYDLSFIRRFSSGAAPLSEEILQLLKKKFPQTGFKQGYGMTESCSCITAHPPSHYDYKHAHAVGTICASTTVKIMKDDGTEAGIGEPGEIWAKGPQIVMGYLNNEKATKETFDEDGYLHTGDQGVIDEDGLITILDRIKEMIKVKGIGVAPAELEDLLLGHEKVEDVAVLGIADDYSGEVPKAYVVPKSEHQKEDLQALGRALITYVMEKKVRYKAVKEVEFIEAIPKSASGKILRRVLKDKEKAGQHGVVVREERANL
ncbi:acetyl-CoA synthetase-like protein [Polychaeton citri CBS 116435]|uniref:Acetyl-CoA synthetase-like protein n=1 Tax=Polychaeton citri CBS 116435 TaxID=1314669 RepID=A0A9P4UT44_9PEZI|nr:acetyl-CoA synthetase-like protein [Polychaeton citri CBS 116435]